MRINLNLVFLVVILNFGLASASLADSTDRSIDHRVMEKTTVPTSNMQMTTNENRAVHSLGVSHDEHKVSLLKAMILKEFHSPIHAIPSNSR